MEVHHHPDLHHKKKKFKEYFLEFLMIFLAVTMGFIAENIREHFVERQHEKEYMVSLVRDLNNDLFGMNEQRKTRKNAVAMADTMIMLFKNADYSNTSGRIYYLGRALSLRSVWRTNDGTSQQLNYAGGLRIIQNKRIVDSIQNYINLMRNLFQIMTLEDIELAEYRKALSKVFSGFTFDEMVHPNQGQVLVIDRITNNPDFISYDKKDINDLIIQAHIVKSNRMIQLSMFDRDIPRADELINLIRKEYNLENE